MSYKYENMEEAIDDDIDNWKQTIESYKDEDDIDAHRDRIVNHIVRFAWLNSKRRKEIKDYANKKLDDKL